MPDELFTVYNFPTDIFFTSDLTGRYISHVLHCWCAVVRASMMILDPVAVFVLFSCMTLIDHFNYLIQCEAGITGDSAVPFHCSNAFFCKNASQWKFQQHMSHSICNMVIYALNAQPAQIMNMLGSCLPASSMNPRPTSIQKLYFKNAFTT